MDDKDLKIEFIALALIEYAVHKNIPIADAYSYLSKYQGISFLDECYNIEHTLSMENIIEDLDSVCENNGGQRYDTVVSRQ